MSHLADSERSDRAQVVLVGAAVVAIAFLTMSLAYAQLGYDADRTGAGAVEVVSVEDVDRAVEASVRAAARAEAASDRDRTWEARDAVAHRIRESVTVDLNGLERRYAESDRSVTVAFDDEAASAWSNAHCPGGPGRQFGPCRSIDGIVVQERAGVVTPVAAGFEVRVVSPAESTTATIVVRAV